MATKTKDELKALSDQPYPTNGRGLITAEAVRAFNNDLIDNLGGDTPVLGEREAWCRIRVTYYDSDKTELASVAVNHVSIPGLFSDVSVFNSETARWKSFSLGLTVNRDIGEIVQYGVFSSIDYVNPADGDSAPFVMRTITDTGANKINITAGVINEMDLDMSREMALMIRILYI